MKAMTQMMALLGLMSVLAMAVEPAALEKLKLPGIKINAKEAYVDVDAEVCLDAGALELVACTPETKEHESIIKVLAKPVHMHMALLLIGAQPGNPATQRMVGEGDEKRFLYLPARGQPVHVSLVIADKEGKKKEHPISHFIQHVEDETNFFEGGQKAEENRKFPTNEFLFLGSVLFDNGKGGPRRYLAEESGNVISISTFGDETLGLSEVYEHVNGSLVWEINTDHLPEMGTKVTLRLRPVFKPAEEKPNVAPKPSKG